MDLIELLPVIDSMAHNPLIRDLRAITYLATYPSIRALGTAPGPVTLERFHQIATMAYGWMPRIVRLDSNFIEDALAASIAAQTATPETLAAVPFSAIASCLHSVVGASKVLHFINPAVFPIWDRGIEQFRLHGELTDAHMNDVANYLEYAGEVHHIRHEAAFPEFFVQFNAALNSRLAALGIDPYDVSGVRAIESAAFELSREGHA
ncbi:MAG: hypothetical protein HY872_14995 [Chloroflexi bacterium]|nr:hypothetical protein [Chloroflexota bacterium]